MKARQIIPLIFGVLSLIFALIFPHLTSNSYLIHTMILFFLSTIMGQSWNILGGYAGQYSVGHAAYFGAGAYATLILFKNFNIPPWFGMFGGIFAAIIIALLIGSICFRLRGPYFVLASIAVTEIIRLTALNLKGITNGAEGILVTEIPSFKLGDLELINFSSKVPFYYIGLGWTLFTMLGTYFVQHSKLGYYLQAIREDQDAAHSLGISLSYYKNAALVISAVFTSIAGSLYAIYLGYIDPGTVLSLDMSVQIVLICIIGGVGTIYGPVIGSVVLVALSEALRSNLLTQGLFALGWISPESATGKFLNENLAHAHVLIYGLLVVLVILYMPQGVLGFIKKLFRERLRHGAT